MHRKITANDSNSAALKLAYRVRGHTRSFVKRVSEWTKSYKVIKDHTLHSRTFRNTFISER